MIKLANSTKNILIQIRPHQYIKNLFIFLPLFFAARIMDFSLLANAAIAFVAFSFTASGIYTFNDYHDIEEDRQHPKKKNRPLASGAISKSGAVVITTLLLIAGFTIMALLSLKAAGILSAYMAMNIAYSLHLKHFAILDVVIIAIGFVLRLFIGSIVTSTTLSIWIVVMTFLLALFLALAKRRDDVLIYLATGEKTRKVIDGYNMQFINTSMSIMASVVIVAYVIYTTSFKVLSNVQHGQYFYLTSLFVIIGVMRYMQITFVFEDSGSPTKVVLKDKFVQIIMLGWIITFAWIIY